MGRYIYILAHFIVVFIFSSIISAQSSDIFTPHITKETFGDTDWDTETSPTNPAPSQAVGYAYHWDFDDVTTFTVRNGHWIAGSDSSVRINKYSDNAPDEVYAESMHLFIAQPDHYSGSWDTVILADIDINGYKDFELEFAYTKKPDHYSTTPYRGLVIDVRVDNGSWIALDTSYIPYGNTGGQWELVNIPMTGIPVGEKMDIMFSSVKNQNLIDNVTLNGVNKSFWDNATGHINIGVQEQVWGNIGSSVDCSGELYLAWDADYLYGVAKIRDDIISSPNENTWWENDAISLKFDIFPASTVYDPGNSGFSYYDIKQVDFNAEGSLAVSLSGTTNTMVYREYTGEGYNIEFAVPFNEIVNNGADPAESFNPYEGKQVGFLFEINDNDGGDNREGVEVWGHEPVDINYYRNIEQFGTLTLIPDNQVRLSQINVSEADAIFPRLPDGYAPTIDGTVDGIWEDIDMHYIDLFLQNEVPSFDSAYWQAAWNDTSIFVIVRVADDDFYPSYEDGSDITWVYDRNEVYFDVNEVIYDGGGPGNTAGHYQIAPAFTEGENPYVLSDYLYSGASNEVPVTYAYNINDPDYVYEYEIDIVSLFNNEGSSLDPNTIDEMGFDIYVIDRDAGDAGRRTAVWKNKGLWEELTHNFNNMDSCGKIKFGNETVEYPHAVFYRFPEGCAPVIDGDIDPVWSDVEEHYIDINTVPQDYLPTLGLVTWRAAWNDSYLFVLLTVEDDDFFPAFDATGTTNWEYDRPEIYIDVNDEINDGGGPAGVAGHYQVCPYFVENKNQYDSTVTDLWSGSYSNYVTLSYGYKVTDPNYVFEYAISIESLPDVDGNSWDPHARNLIGFDVIITDRDYNDNGRRFATWKNDQADGAWNNMDCSGEVLLSNTEISTSVAPLSVTVTTDANLVCAGQGVLLHAVPSGAAASYTYSWKSQPSGFSSSVSDPFPAPTVSTIYTVEVSDGINTASGSKTINPYAVPDKPEILLKGKDILICLDSGLYSYEWYYGDVVILDETRQFCRINSGSTGNYYVRTGLENGCKTKSDPYVKVESAYTSEDGISVKVYPVPNTGNFSIIIPGNESGRVYINIRDFSGQIIRNMLFEKDADPVYKDICVEKINKGLYIIEILFNKNVCYKKILIE